MHTWRGCPMGRRASSAAHAGTPQKLCHVRLVAGKKDMTSLLARRRRCSLRCRFSSVLRWGGAQPGCTWGGGGRMLDRGGSPARRTRSHRRDPHGPAASRTACSATFPAATARDTSRRAVEFEVDGLVRRSDPSTLRAIAIPRPLRRSAIVRRALRTRRATVRLAMRRCALRQQRVPAGSGTRDRDGLTRAPASRNRRRRLFISEQDGALAWSRRPSAAQAFVQLAVDDRANAPARLALPRLPGHPHVSSLPDPAGGAHNDHRSRRRICAPSASWGSSTCPAVGRDQPQRRRVHFAATQLYLGVGENAALASRRTD